MVNSLGSLTLKLSSDGNVEIAEAPFPRRLLVRVTSKKIDALTRWLGNF